MTYRPTKIRTSWLCLITLLIVTSSCGSSSEEIQSQVLVIDPNTVALVGTTCSTEIAIQNLTSSSITLQSLLVQLRTDTEEGDDNRDIQGIIDLFGTAFLPANARLASPIEIDTSSVTTTPITISIIAIGTTGGASVATFAGILTCS